MTAATIRTAATGAVPTFYVSSSTGHGDYIVKRFKRPNGPNAPPMTVTCNCPDYNHRGQVLGLPCKHIHLVQMLAKVGGGWTKIKPGRTYTISIHGGN